MHVQSNRNAQSQCVKIRNIKQKTKQMYIAEILTKKGGRGSLPKQK